MEKSETLKPLTEKISQLIVDTDENKIPDEIYEHAKVAFMDWLAVTFGGKDDELVKKLIKYSDLIGGNKQATIIGHNIKKSIQQAALINGSASHALDYDDTLVSFLGHPSVTIFPSILALSEFEEKSGKEMLTAYIIGLQVGATIGACASLDHYLAGWHATSTLGHIASAAACSRLLKLTKQQTLYALGLSATQSSGLKRNFGTMTKPFHAGRASESGLLSALLARDNFTSAVDIFESPQGFFQALKGGVNDDVFSLIGMGWDVVNLSQKYHASCHATHSPLEAALEIVKNENIDINNIKIIKVYSSELAIGAASKNNPVNGTECKFSIPFCVANALINGETGIQAFTDENLNSIQIQEFMKKISVIHDPEIKALESRVEIEAADNTFQGFSDILQEIPPLDKKQSRIKDKFLDLCSSVIEKNKAIEILDILINITEINNIKELTLLL